MEEESKATAKALLCAATGGLGDGLQNAAKGLLGPERLAATGFLVAGAVTGFLAGGQQGAA